MTEYLNYLLPKSVFFALLLSVVLVSACAVDGETKPSKDQDQSTSESSLDNLLTTYKNIKDDVFLTRWTLLDPVHFGSNEQDLKVAHNQELIGISDLWDSISTGKIIFESESYDWKSIHSDFSYVHLGRYIEPKNYAYTYAVAEIESDKKATGYFGVGSKAALKIWLNGELIHESFISTKISPDQYLVPYNLKNGANQLIIKVLHADKGWAFLFRALSKSASENAFVNLSPSLSNGEIDRFLQYGINIDARNNLGLTALHGASLSGDTVRESALIERGADKDIAVPNATSQISNYFSNLAYENSSGFSYLIARNGKVLTKGGKGLANVSSANPNDTETRFHAGSITKQFTAVSILQLQEKGLLSLSDPLEKYYPGFSRAEQVTLRHLMNHTSGLFEPDGSKELFSQHIDPRDFIKVLEKQDLYFKPGEQWRYSNSAYVVLGLIIEKVSGLSLDEYLKANVFSPLGMKNSGIYDSSLSYINEAIGYAVVDEKTVKAVNQNVSSWNENWNGANGLYSTVEDLFIWNEALHNGEVLSEKSYIDATNPTVFSNGFKPYVEYGFGIGIENIMGQRALVHGGEAPGFHAELLWLPEEKLTFVFLSNTKRWELKYKARTAEKVVGVMLGGE